MGARRSRGVTLVELMVAIAILGGMAALALANLGGSRRKLETDRATHDLRARVERVRAMSRAAGSRLGSARLVYGPNCNVSPGQLLWIEVQANQVRLPVSTRYNAANDTLRVNCQLWDFGGQGGALGKASFDFPTATPFVFGFAANGRLAFPGRQAPQDVFLRLRHNQGGPSVTGLRVLPGGATCFASNPNLVGPNNACDR